jgi:HEAT repeat protein
VTRDQLRPLIEQLDNASFRTREQASARLTEYGERAVPALRDLAAAATSEEARTRLNAVIAGIGRLKPDETETRFIDELPTYIGTYPNARRILEALSKNSPDANVTVQAKRVLAEYDIRKAKLEKK